MQVAYRGHTIQIDDNLAVDLKKYLGVVPDRLEFDSALSVFYGLDSESEIEKTVARHPATELSDVISASFREELECFAGKTRREQTA
jgi:hypothetical protein